MKSLQKFILEKFEATPESIEMSTEISQAIINHVCEKFESGMKNFHLSEINIGGGHDWDVGRDRDDVYIKCDQNFKNFIQNIIPKFISDIKANLVTKKFDDRNPARSWKYKQQLSFLSQSNGIYEKEFKVWIKKCDPQDVNKIYYVASGAIKKFTYKQWQKGVNVEMLDFDQLQKLQQFIGYIMVSVAGISNFNFTEQGVKLETQFGQINFSWSLDPNWIGHYSIMLKELDFKPNKK